MNATMIELKAHHMQRQIEKAKEMHPTVKRIAENTYSVSGSKGNTYTVKLAKGGRHYLGECNCRALHACYHIAAACSLHIAIKRGYSKESPAPVVPKTRREKARDAAAARLMRETAVMFKPEGNAMRIGNNPILV